MRASLTHPSATEYRSGPFCDRMSDLNLHGFALWGCFDDGIQKDYKIDVDVDDECALIWSHFVEH